MRSLLLTVVLLIAALQTAQAVDITLCDMVANDQAAVVPLKAQLDDGREVTLSGILTKPPGLGPFPVVLILPGGGGLRTPYCYAAVVGQFASWGYATLIIASTTAQDGAGKPLFEYSFVDQGNHARGARNGLAEIGNIDVERVAVWGFSRGGMAALTMAASPTARADGFKAIIAAAPNCPSKVVEPYVPVLVVIGSKDESVSVEICKEFAARLEESSEFDFLLLPGANHVFWQNPSAAELSANRMKSFLSDKLK